MCDSYVQALLIFIITIPSMYLQKKMKVCNKIYIVFDNLGYLYFYFMKIVLDFELCLVKGLRYEINYVYE